MKSHAVSARFETTRWSLVLRSRRSDPEAARALDAVCRMYWSPLYAYARRWGRSQADAEDAVQAFFVTALRRDLFATADPGKGRLRNLLLTAFKRHLQDLAGAAAAARRAPLQTGAWVELSEVEERLAAADTGSEAAYDREWAHAVLAGALARLEDRYRGENRLAVFQTLRPLLTDDPDAATRSWLAADLGLTPSAFHVAVHRLRKRYREAMQETIAATVEDDAQIEEEFRALAAILGG
jgi:RNA polymerase sigma-70 factor (ECF subfamily)